MDALLGLAITALENNFIKPTLLPILNSTSQQSTEILEGRNPIVEQLLTNKKFIANDILFNNKQKLIILTGPNASGKSCFIRPVSYTHLTLPTNREV